jgi:hypothetical protein
MTQIDELRNIRKRLQETVEALDRLIGTENQAATNKTRGRESRRPISPCDGRRNMHDADVIALGFRPITN